MSYKLSHGALWKNPMWNLLSEKEYLNSRQLKQVSFPLKYLQEWNL